MCSCRLTCAASRRRAAPGDRIERRDEPRLFVTVARRHALSPQQLFTWRREIRKAAEAMPAFVPAMAARYGLSDTENGPRTDSQDWGWELITADDEATFAVLCEQVTAERVAAHFGALVAGIVTS